MGEVSVKGTRPIMPRETAGQKAVGEHPWLTGYATDALAAGVDVQTVATQMGHRDLSMLSKVYQHLQRKGQFLKDAQAKATAGVWLEVG